MLFDIRTIVAGLLGSYGVILIVTAAVHNSAADRLRSGGWNINLWSGLGMLAAAAIFMAWTFARPVGTPGPTRVPQDAVKADGTDETVDVEVKS
ncbi:hypothetical protein ACFYUD_11730 [Nocardia tengchongensis]|uniref:hypothetical protein n=1 Tax=Nocardia tengchongensis TaxID=2055889 RepID=UPI0036C59DD7